MRAGPRFARTLARLASPLATEEAERRRRAGIVILAGLVALLVLPLSLTAPWRLVEARAFDYLSTFRPPPRPVPGPIVVAIDEPSLSEIGLQWPWPRDLHAKLIVALRKAGARAIGLDIIFAEPSSEKADAALEAALGPDVVLAGDETLIQTPQADQLVRTEPLPRFRAAGARTGLASIALDGDGVLRRLPAYPDGFAAVLQAAAGGSPQPAEGTRLIQAFGPTRTYETVSYYQALDPAAFLPPGIFEGRTVIVGLSMQSAPSVEAAGVDARATPFTLRSGRLVSGAEIQATILDNLAAHLYVTPAPVLALLAASLGAALLAGLLVWRGTGWRTLLWSALATVAAVAASWSLLRFGRVYLPPAAPALAFSAVAAVQGGRDYAAERRLRRDIMRAFSQYLSPVLVERLARHPDQLRLGGERRTLSILFCDVRGFTAIAEAMRDDPEGLTSLVNRLLSPLSDAVIAAGGTIDKYMGDCIMAFWNAPLDDPDHARHAVEAGLAMLAALEALNAQLAAEAGAGPATRLNIGVGINTGECIVGNMGSKMRFDYSAIGDAVNLASRLEGQTRNYGVPILLGEETARHLGGSYCTVELDRVAVKGRAALTAVSTVLPDPGAEALALHAGLLQAFYRGELAANDPRLAMLAKAIPGLSAYYAGLAARLAPPAVL